MCLFPAIVVKIPHQHQQHQNILQQHNKEYIPSAGAGLGVGSEGAAGEKNMHDAEFTCALFRFIQLTCEGHNLGESAAVYTSLRIYANTFLRFPSQSGRTICAPRRETQPL